MLQSPLSGQHVCRPRRHSNPAGRARIAVFCALVTLAQGLAAQGPDAHFTGRVLDAAGQPLAGATLFLTPRAPQRAAGIERVASEPTGPDGRFAIEAPSPHATSGASSHRRMDVHVERPGFAPELLPARLPGTELTVALNAPAALSGRILDQRGLALSAAEVRLVRTWSDGGHYRQVTSTHTDASGRYRFEQLPGGRYLVDVRAQGFAPLVFGTDVASGAQVERDAVASSGVRVHGQVLDARGEPLANARLGTATATAWSELSALELGQAAAVSDAHGTFELVLDPTLRSDPRARLRVSAAQHRPLSIRLAPLSGSLRITLEAQHTEGATPDQAVEPITDSRLPAELQEPQQSRALAGQVLDIFGLPIPGSGVVLRTQGSETRLAIADRSGHFTFEALPESPCALWITPPVDPDRPAGVHAIGLCGVSAGGAALEIVLPPAAWTTGRVVDPSGQALAGLRVYAHNPRAGVMQHAVTAIDGTFRLSLPTGTRSDIRVASGTAQRSSVSLSAVPAGTCDLELVAPQADVQTEANEPR